MQQIKGIQRHFRIFPGVASVCLPSETATTPLTIKYLIPDENCEGSSSPENQRLPGPSIIFSFFRTRSYTIIPSYMRSATSGKNGDGCVGLHYSTQTSFRTLRTFPPIIFTMSSSGYPDFTRYLTILLEDSVGFSNPFT